MDVKALYIPNKSFKTQGIFPAYNIDKGRNSGPEGGDVLYTHTQALGSDRLRSESCRVLSFTSSVT